MWVVAIGMHYGARYVSSKDAGTAGYKKYMCVHCSFIYDEAAGLPAEGIAPGTRWEDVPDTWRCPDCGVGKEEFEMVEI